MGFLEAMLLLFIMLKKGEILIKISPDINKILGNIQLPELIELNIFKIFKSMPLYEYKFFKNGIDSSVGKRYNLASTLFFDLDSQKDGKHKVGLYLNPLTKGAGLNLNKNQLWPMFSKEIILNRPNFFSYLYIGPKNAPVLHTSIVSLVSSDKFFNTATTNPVLAAIKFSIQTENNTYKLKFDNPDPLVNVGLLSYLEKVNFKVFFEGFMNAIKLKPEKLSNNDISQLYTEDQIRDIVKSSYNSEISNLIQIGDVSSLVSYSNQCKFIYFNDIRSINDLANILILDTGSNVKRILINNNILEINAHLYLKTLKNPFELLDFHIRSQIKDINRGINYLEDLGEAKFQYSLKEFINARVPEQREGMITFSVSGKQLYQLIYEAKINQNYRAEIEL